MTKLIDIVVVGAGFAGLRTLHTMREQGLSVAVLEAGEGLGGVWYWNRYPGARCDVASYDYSYAFSDELQQEWRWSERFASQPEILRYVNHVADRFDLRRDIHLGQRVSRATYDEDSRSWTVATETGRAWRGRFLVMAVGNLSRAKQPHLPGLERFAGAVHHTARWPHEPVGFSGRRVGVIGTGSSAVQMIPIVAREAAHLTVFQRTPNYSVPAANAPISDEEDALVRARYGERRERARNSSSGLGFTPGKQKTLEATEEERRARYDDAWDGLGFGFIFTYPDLLTDEAANETAAEFVRSKIAAIVVDPDTRERLIPRGFPFGGKRPSVDSGYFEAFNRDNVELVDVRTDPISGVTPTGISTAGGHHDLDMIVFATGFDAMTGSLLAAEIVGRAGLTLRDAWSAGPRTYLGLGVSGFPNLFIITGPGSPSLLSNVLLSIEQHVDWLAELFAHLRAEGTDEIEVTEAAEREWGEHVARRASETLYPQVESYYNGDEVPGKPRVFMPYAGGVRDYRRILEGVAARGYEGFRLRAPVATERV